jgi:RecA/RadA recombinase
MSFQTADKMTKREILQSGVRPLDRLLGGGLEMGLTYLFYGSRSIRECLHRIAVHAQLPLEKGGMDLSSILIDNENMTNIETFTHWAFEFGLDPDIVMDNIFVSRAFNSSQTYDVVMNQLDSFFERVPARLLLLPGLADIYYGEGPVNAEGKQHLTHMAHRLMTFTMKHNIVTIVTGSSSQRYRFNPAAGHGLKHSTQIHVYVEETKDRLIYNLVKHPQYPLRKEQEYKPNRKIMAATLPLSHFLDGIE